MCAAVTSLTINVLTICMLYYIYRVWTTWQSSPNARVNTTELAPVYDEMDFSRPAIITVNHSRVNQSRVNQSMVDQSRVNQSRVNQSRMIQSGMNQSNIDSYDMVQTSI